MAFLAVTICMFAAACAAESGSRSTEIIYLTLALLFLFVGVFSE